MTTQSDEAITELRAWSRPGRRAELIAAVWDAGEQRIPVLAEAARISRPTVYTDLRSRGIEPSDRSEQDAVLTSEFTPVTLDGFTGNDPVADAALFEQRLRARLDEDPARSAGEEGSRLLELLDTVRLYNKLRPLQIAEQIARRERDRALHQVEARWEALMSTPAGWLAAHHAYVVALKNARTAITAWSQRAQIAVEAQAAAQAAQLDLTTQRAYQEILAAGHPPLRLAPGDPAADAEYLLDRVQRTAADRKELIAETTALLAQRDDLS
ncbi:hypothetical protein [Kitasatospora griseola]|uniref:hypothetical protein n=1 Tax=Kitasatospora griseola TaxID=2064 RepID=UPI00343F1431